MIVLKKKQLVTVEVIYYIPDSLILNEFFWQTEDLVPDLPRIHKFLIYWKNEIRTPIKEVLVSVSTGKLKIADFDGFLN